MAKHPGFQAVQAKIAKKEGIPKQNAGAILASAARKASPAAKKANPRLMKVSSSKKIAAAYRRGMT
jgi:hypothetical protein